MEIFDTAKETIPFCLKISDRLRLLHLFLKEEDSPLDIQQIYLSPRLIKQSSRFSMPLLLPLYIIHLTSRNFLTRNLINLNQMKSICFIYSALRRHPIRLVYGLMSSTIRDLQACYQRKGIYLKNWLVWGL